MKPGDVINTESLGTVTVIKVHPFGTVDVQKGDRAYRITGLAPKGWKR